MMQHKGHPFLIFFSAVPNLMAFNFFSKTAYVAKKNVLSLPSRFVFGLPIPQPRGVGGGGLSTIQLASFWKSPSWAPNLEQTSCLYVFFLPHSIFLLGGPSINGFCGRFPAFFCSPMGISLCVMRSEHVCFPLNVGTNKSPSRLFVSW